MRKLDLDHRYNYRTVLLPDVDCLQSGDILLSLNAESTNPGSGKVAGVITAATKGRFSHALICSTPPTLIEAIGTGVSTLSLARCFAHSFDNVRVLRYPDAEVARKAASLAQLEVGRDYSISRAILSVFPEKTITKINDHGIFCSALIAQVYVKAGAQIFASTAVDRTTPATIDQLNMLIDITRDVFHEALAPNNIETLTALDGDVAPTISSRQTEISNRYAKAMLPIAERIANDYPAMRLKVTPTYFGMLDFVLKAFDVLHTVDQTSRSAALAAVQTLDGELVDLIRSGELAALLDEMEAADGASLQAAVVESFRADPDIDVRAMKGLLVATTKQLEVRRDALRWMTDRNAGRSQSASAYCTLEAQAIAFLEQRERLFSEIITRVA